MENRVSTKVAKDWFITIAYIGLWYAGIAAVVNIVLKIASTFNLPGFKGTELLETASAISYVFMLVLGIVLPLIYQKYYVSLGVTRKQIFQGMALAVVVFAVLIALVHAAIYLVTSLLDSSSINAHQIPLQLARDIILFIFYYLLGWLIASGFTYGRFATAAPTVVIGALATNGLSVLLGDPLVAANASSGPLPEFAVFGIILVATALLAYVLLRVLRNLPFKAT